MPRSRALASRFVLTLVLLVVSGLVGCKSTDSATTPGATTAATAPGLGSAQAHPSASAPRPAPAEARAWQRPLLWRIEGGDKVPTSYLFGTIHLPDARFDVMPAELERAFGSAGAVFTEIPMDAGTQLAMVPKLMLPAGKTLQSIVPQELYAKVEGMFAEKRLPFAPFSSMKPWVVSSQLTLLDKMSLMASKKPLDAVLYSRAESEHKEVGGLETADEQLAVFNGLSLDEEIHMLQTTVDFIEKEKKEGRNLTDETLSAYLEGDQAKLSKILVHTLDTQDKLSAKLKKRLFEDREAKMAERILAKRKAHPNASCFFAVGAGHLVTDDGLVARITKKGFKVTRVEPPTQRMK